MEGPDRATATWFAGDLDDPWVVAIVEALPRETLRLHCPLDLPEAWPIDRPTPSSLVLHRATLSPIDAQRLARLKARADRTPRIVLCVGPQARYVDVERWSRLVEVVIPEATARETVARHALAIERKPRPSGGPRPKVAVVSQNYELRATLAEAARSGGFAVEASSETVDAPPGLATAWDVPVLEPDWPTRLAVLARSSPVVALLGFADRSTVALARQRGASACLDLPCDVADLLSAFDRLATLRQDQAHEVPPQPLGKRVVLARKN
jgi:CheY-like chemotaxis protein